MPDNIFILSMDEYRRRPEFVNDAISSVRQSDLRVDTSARDHARLYDDEGRLSWNEFCDLQR
jgi:hypothetical protein